MDCNKRVLFLALIVPIFQQGFIISADPNVTSIDAYKEKPSAYWFANLTESDKCVFGCMENVNLPKEVIQFLREVGNDVFREENSTNIRRFFNATMLDWYCQFASERQSCMHACGDGRWKTNALILFRPGAYICNESKFIEYSKCYRSVYDEDLDQCESSDQCLPYKMSTLAKFYEGFNGTKFKNASWEVLAADIFRYVCNYINCGNRCRSQTLIAQCGKEANGVLLEFFRRLVASAKHVVSFIHYIFYEKDFPYSDNCGEI